MEQIEIHKSANGNLKLIIQANGDVILNKYAYGLGQVKVCNIREDDDWFEKMAALREKIPRNEWWYQ